MAENILEAVRQQLGHGPIQKVDPNSQEVKHVEALSSGEKLAQAAIPAVLTAFLMFTKSDDNAKQVLNHSHIGLQDLFAGKQNEVVKSIVDYCGAPAAEVENTMEKITQQVVPVLLHAAGPEPAAEKICSYLAGQRHTILTHLPASLQLGELLGDNSLDDRTNKMEGPVSSIAQTIGNALSGSEVPK
ncbi:MAG: hypothetical protein KF862_15080 [Chitinophagaceae bacterium]|nr:hypothetical protein [Chitinophagaceae bacterium]